MTSVATIDNIFVRCGNVSLYACTEPQQTILELKKSLCAIFGHEQATDAVLLYAKPEPKAAPGKRGREEDPDDLVVASDGDVTKIAWTVLEDDTTVSAHKMFNPTDETLLFPFLWLRLRPEDELENYPPLPEVPQEVITSLVAHVKA